MQLHTVDYTGFTGKRPYKCSVQRASKVCLFAVPHRQLELYILSLNQPVGPIDLSQRVWTRQRSGRGKTNCTSWFDVSTCNKYKSFHHHIWLFPCKPWHDHPEFKMCYYSNTVFQELTPWKHSNETTDIFMVKLVIVHYVLDGLWSALQKSLMDLLKT